MKRTFKRTMAMLMAALTLGVGMTGMSASATDWGLYNNPSGPAESRKYYDAAGYYTSSKVTKLYEKCTSYSSDQNSLGVPAKVTYKPYAVSSSGSVIHICTSTREHHMADSSQRTITLNNEAPAYSTIYGNYSLEDYSELYCAIYGYIHS